MGIITEIRLKIGDFYDKNKYYIIAAGILILMVFNINTFLKNLNFTLEPKITKTPSVSVLDETYTFPEKIRKEGEKKIFDFVKLANEGKYDEAVNMLSKENREHEFVNRLEAIGYIKELFPHKKAVDVQAYSKAGDNYVYQVKIFEDFLKSGLTDERYEFKDEKISVTETKEGLALNIRGYLYDEKIKGLYEDNNVKIELLNKKVKFTSETYKIRVTNRTKNKLVLYDFENSKTPPITITYGDGTQDQRKINQRTSIMVDELKTEEYELTFPKLYDGENTGNILEFSSVRFYDNYQPIEANTLRIEKNQQVIDSEHKLNEYSIKIKVEK
ncbi:MAG: hypothetical protein HG467_002880 [Clostridiales bacterium]|nr:hypothetical protein [Clostridiales bacterium]